MGILTKCYFESGGPFIKYPGELNNFIMPAGDSFLEVITNCIFGKTGYAISL
jgi:hypothetical protein